MTGRPVLTLVRGSGIQRLAQHERLIAEAKRLYPHNESLAGKWVEAKLALGDATPKVRIGPIGQQATMFPRTLKR